MSNLEIWDKHADINPKFTKAITGKAYKGTSPSPQHVAWCLTDLFGPIGIGWGMRVIAEGFTPLGDEVLHWCRVEFWHTDRSNTFETYGQTKALASTRNGPKADEDAPKKSQTDAMVKAASYVGVAANIFLGRWDDAKYVQSLEQQFAEPQGSTSRQMADDILANIGRQKTAAHLKELWANSKPELGQLADPHFSEVKSAFEKRGKELMPPDPAMQAPENGAQYQ